MFKHVRSGIGAVLAALASGSIQPVSLAPPHHMGRTRYPAGWRGIDNGRYRPHQGEREIARRQRQAERDDQRQRERAQRKTQWGTPLYANNVAKVSRRERIVL